MPLIGKCSIAEPLAHLLAHVFRYGDDGLQPARPTSLWGAPEKTDYAKLLGIPNAPTAGFPSLGFGGGAIPLSNIGFGRAIRLPHLRSRII
jgi:hypothetical protein